MTDLVFDVANAAGCEPVNLDPAATSNKIVIDYRDSDTNAANVAWTIDWLVGDGDDLVEAGELAEITVNVSTQALAANQAFTLEVKPSLGGTMVIARTTPAGLDTVVDLH